MKAKPILSTPILTYRQRPEIEDAYYTPRNRFCCAEALAEVFRLAEYPQRLRLHAYKRPAKARVAICLQARVYIFWSARATALPTAAFYDAFEAWLLASALGPDLRSGKTITLYVELEVVEAAK